MSSPFLRVDRCRKSERPTATVAAVLAVTTLCLVCCTSGLLSAEEADPFADRLAAGEFGPALEAARQSSDRQQREARLQQLAAAQAAAGARRAALTTLSELDDDRLRASRFAELAAAGGRPGGDQADFDSLIELIKSTIAPQSWDDVGGPGSIAPFAGGVYVDAEGMIRPLLRQDSRGALEALREAARQPAVKSPVGQSSPLRKVSLTRLERQVQLHLAAGLPIDDPMRYLAGLQRLRYVLIYPESRDIVLAGPADGWRTDSEGRVVGIDSGRPVLRLDDLVVVLRHMLGQDDARFGCSITPTQDALARTQQFLARGSQQPLKPHQRDGWLKQLRDHLGPQTIEVYGIDPRTRAAQVIVEADYRMKLVGMGLEEGVAGVPSYLAMIQVPAGQAPPPMDVLRWWFTLDYSALLTTPARDAYEMRGQGVRVLSENELLTATGQRVHTGKSDELNRQFADNFTRHFPLLAAKYPVYAELQNLCDLALVGALLRAEGVFDRAGWQATCFGPGGNYQPALGAAPKSVETVINHRVVNRVHIIVGVSGGVRIDPAKFVQPEAIEIDRYGLLEANRHSAQPRPMPREHWWWD
jgi:hypothetical protein